MEIKINRKLWRVLSVTFIGLFAFFIAGGDIAIANQSVINKALNVQTFKTEVIGDGEDPDTDYFPTPYASESEVKAACRQSAEDIEGEGLVLLTNKNDALPIESGSKISLLGQGTIKSNYSASGSSAAVGVTYPYFYDVLSSEGFTVNPKTIEFYSIGPGSSYGRSTYMLVGQVNEAPWSSYDTATKNSLAEYGDAVIVTFCRDAGEGEDVGLRGSDGEDGSYLSISRNEEELLKQLTLLKNEGKIKKIVVILNMAVPMETDFLFRDTIDVDACLWIGNVGTYGFTSVARVLKGEINPSGHLSDTFLRDNFSSPAVASWALNKNLYFTQKYSNAKDYNLKSVQQNYGVYVEGIYVGYRYYETRYEDVVLGRNNVGEYDYFKDVSFPFGHGLSYSSFEYSNLDISENNDSYIVNVRVTNNGPKAGKDAVQVYIQKPYSQYDIQHGIEKSSVELVGYKKTPIIESGKSVQVTIDVSKEELKSYDADGAKTYILDQGEHILSVGENAHDALNNILALKGKNISNGMDYNGDKSLAKVVLNIPNVDMEIYSKSLETGAAITNQLDFMDINRYKNSGTNHVTYVSRNNWSGTWPKEAVSLSVANDKMAYDLGSNKEMPDVDEEFPTYGADNGLQIIGLRSTEKNIIDYNSDAWNLLLDQMTFGEMAYLLTCAGYSTVALPSVGKPGTADNDGPTSILGTKTGTVFPGKGVWASTFNDELIESAAVSFAADVRLAGFQSLYAPGINIHRTPFGGRLNEYYSEDSFLSGSSCVAEVKGLQSLGVVPTVKHFAFNNEEHNRNGVCVWMNEQEAREIMLKPYEMALRPSLGNAHGIMTSFNRAGCIWTSASKELMENIIRDEWAFDGYSLTDMAASNAAFYMVFNDGIYNGTDLFLGSGTEESLNEWKNNKTFAKKVRESCHRVLYVIANYSCVMNGKSSNTRIVPITPWWQQLITSLTISFGILGVTSCTIFVLSYFPNITENKKKHK